MKYFIISLIIYIIINIINCQDGNIQNENKNINDFCEKEKNKILEEKEEIEKKLKDCNNNAKHESNKHKEIHERLKKQINECNEENKVIEKSRGDENGDNCDIELKKHIQKLEKQIKENENTAKQNKNFENYLISSNIIINFVYKIFSLYKTIYFIIIQKTYIENLMNKIWYHKNLLIIKLKILLFSTYENINVYIKLLKNKKHVQIIFENIKKIKKCEFYQIIKNNLVNITLNLKEKLKNTYTEAVPKIKSLKQILILYLLHFKNKLQNNSDILLDYLYSVNPEVKGIIPSNLLDQTILLIFFTIVNMISIYLFIYFSFIIFKIIKFILFFILKLFSCIITSIFKIFFFFLTLPIKPFLKKKVKNRKVYKTPKENVYQDKKNYQNEFRKSNKDQFAKQRK